MNERLKGGVIAVGVLAVAAVIWWATAGDLFEPEHIKYRSAVSGVLLDPQSAQFRNEKITEGGLYCGEVNSKNRMGGYVGFNRFIVRTKDSAGVLEPGVEIGAGLYGSELLLAELGYRRNPPAEIAGLSEPDFTDATRRLAVDGVWKATCQ